MKYLSTHHAGMLAVAVAAQLAISSVYAEPKIPAPIGPVTDLTSTLTVSQVEELGKGLRLLRARKNGIQMVIAVVPDMSGEEVAPYASAMFRQWGIGKKGEDKGLLLLVAKKERKVRFEVGYGLEGDLPDALTKRIIAKFGPSLTKGDYYAAFNTAIVEVGAAVKKE